MKCLSCKTENEEGVAYCQQCGAYLPIERTREYFDILKALLLSVTIVGFFYFFYLPSSDNYYVRQLFDGVISEAISGLTVWSLFMVGFKFLRYREQVKAFRTFRHQELNKILEQGIYVQTVEERLGTISEFMRSNNIKRYQSSLIFLRVRRIFNYIKAIPKKEEINKIFDYQAQLDFNRMENGYSLMNVFIWAIPILGFIGTVFGIGEAIAEFSDFIRSVSSVELGGQMRSALGGVTAGLSVAFNTTFLALVFVIPIMVFSSFLRKSEEDLLLQIEEYCLEEVLPHLHIIPGQEVEREAFDDHMQKIMQLSGNWMARLEPLLESITHYAGGLKAQIDGLQPIVKDFSNVVFDAKDQQDAPPKAKPSLSKAPLASATPPKTEVVPKTGVAPKPVSQTVSTPESKTEAVSETEIETIPEAKTEVTPESKAEAVPESKVEVIPEAKNEVIPEREPEVVSKPEVEPVSELEAKILPDTETIIIPKQETETIFIPERETETIVIQDDSETIIIPKTEVIPELDIEVVPGPETEIIPGPTGEVLPEVPITPVELSPEAEPKDETKGTKDLA